ncbi:hypothetical protein TNCV_4538431 [Trichonephila clavipes]|uniref:Uncharacterized protein n=1 Tax=Trichonephila clavipes TaxID=2585209 RepID=A0A8X6WES6_TRICX|nr:hypothetical protein TNCV_4538431 [Trichonephila clavipes]
MVHQINGRNCSQTSNWQLTQEKKIQQKITIFSAFGYEPRLPRELHIGSFIDDTPLEDQLDLVILARAETANNVYEPHLENKIILIFIVDLGYELSQGLSFMQVIVGLISSRQEISHYTTGRNTRRSQTLSHLQRTIYDCSSSRAVCYEIKSRTLQNKLIKVVYVQNLRPYFKRDAYVMQNNTLDEENDSSAENQDPVEDHQEVSVTTELSPSRNHLHRNHRPLKDLNNMFPERLIFNYATISNILCLFKKKNSH